MEKIYLMTTSSLRTSDGQLNNPDRLIWEAIKEDEKGAHFYPDEVNAMFVDGSVKLFVKGKEIKPGRLIIRSTRDMEERTYEVACCFKDMGGVVVDSPESLVYPVGKLLPFVHRQRTIKLPKTIFFTIKDDNSRYEMIKDNLKYPFIIKPQKGFGGAGVALIDSEEDLIQYLGSSNEKHLMAQEYIKDIVDEFRVIVIGGKALGVAKKLSNNIAKNATLGGTFEKVEDKEVIGFAEKAAHFEKADILGTDIARTPDGSLWLIENNRNPNFTAFREATGIMVEENILQFVLSKE